MRVLAVTEPIFWNSTCHVFEVLLHTINRPRHALALLVKLQSSSAARNVQGDECVLEEVEQLGPRGVVTEESRVRDVAQLLHVFAGRGSNAFGTLGKTRNLGDKGDESDTGRQGRARDGTDHWRVTARTFPSCLWLVICSMNHVLHVSTMLSSSLLYSNCTQS